MPGIELCHSVKAHSVSFRLTPRNAFKMIVPASKAKVNAKVPNQSTRQPITMALRFNLFINISMFSLNDQSTLDSNLNPQCVRSEYLTSSAEQSRPFMLWLPASLLRSLPGQGIGGQACKYAFTIATQQRGFIHKKVGGPECACLPLGRECRIRNAEFKKCLGVIFLPLKIPGHSRHKFLL